MLRQGNTAAVRLILHHGCCSVRGRKMAGEKRRGCQSESERSKGRNWMKQLVAADLGGDWEREKSLLQPCMKKETTQWKAWRGIGKAFYIHRTQHLWEKQHGQGSWGRALVPVRLTDQKEGKLAGWNFNLFRCVGSTEGNTSRFQPCVERSRRRRRSGGGT